MSFYHNSLGISMYIEVKKFGLQSIFIIFINHHFKDAKLEKKNFD